MKNDQLPSSTARAAHHGMTRRDTLRSFGFLGLAGLGGAGLTLPVSRARAAALATHTAPASLEPDSQASQGAGFYKFTVGSLELAAIGDGGMTMPSHPNFGREATAEEVNAVLAKDFLPPNEAALAINATIIKIGSEVILVDTGRGGDNPTLVKHLANYGVKPADITAVILTHMHGDHIAGIPETDEGNTKVWRRFPNARYFISKAEAEHWEGPNPDYTKPVSPEEWKGGGRNAAAATLRLMSTDGGKLERLGDGDKILEHASGSITAHSTFGHTPGHQVIRVSSGSDQLLIIGDCIHHPTLSLRKPDWTMQFDSSAKIGAETRRKVLTQCAGDRTLVSSYHLPFPGLGHVRADGDAFEWVPTGWKWQN